MFRESVSGYSKAILLTWLVSLCCACDYSPRLAPLASDARILAFGDSLTWGTGAAPDQSYPAQLARLTGHEVINAGVPGEISAAGLRRLPQLLQTYTPQLLILCHGGNDILRRMPEADTASNLQSMIDMARLHNIDVVMVGVPEYGVFLSTADFYTDLATFNHILIDDNLLGKILRQPALKSDQIHPNADGYALMAQSIAKLLVQGGAIE